MKMATVQALNQSLSYSQYRQLVSDLLLKGTATSGETDPEYIHYTQLNHARMKRLDKTIAVPEELAARLLAIRSDFTWLVLSEGWCGDAAQILPVLEKMAVIAPKVTLRIALRDHNDALMQQFLTNGTRSIPKLILLDDKNEVAGQWGPRPKDAAALITGYKQQYGVIDETAKTELQLWYAKDKGVSVMQEVIEMMEMAQEAMPR